MRHLPLFALLRGRACLVVGGGAVAERRARLLLEAGAHVTVLAPELAEPLESLAAAQPALTLARGSFDAEPLEPYWLVVAATNDRDANAAVAAAAERAKRFCNVVDDPEHCSFIMPAIVDRDPVTIAISSAGASPVLSRWIKGVVETALPARLGAFARLAGAWRARTREALPDPVHRRRFWERVVSGRVAEHAYAGRDEAAELELERELEAERDGSERGGGTASTAPGEAYLVGAGPGNPDLITLRGRQLLAAADVVLYDRLAAPELLEFARREAELISVGKSPQQPSITQAQINRLLVELVRSGKRVCRLKGGDPLVFGRGGEEMEALVEAGLPFQIVPGISAVEGCAAYAGIPLTLRGISQAVVIATGHTKEHAAGDLASFRPGQTLALYMGVRQYEQIRAELVGAGHDPATPAAIIERGTTDAQRVIRTALGLLPQARDRFEIRPPALLLVGPTAALAERYQWFAPGRLEIFDCERGGSLERGRAPSRNRA
ncbi:MAG TPA: siroheme synthase CysG [Gammaproteobacteria bacterium]|nr:siroheme synthase CysG [Gammaproteobacteria bacterium]